MLGLSLGIPFRPYDRSAIQQMLDALRRNNGSLWYVPDNALGDGAPNLLSSPEDFFGSGWVKQSVTVTASVPNKIIPIAGAFGLRGTISVAIPNDSRALTTRARVKVDGYNFAHITLSNNVGRASFDLANNLATTYSGVGATAYVVDDTDGYKLITFTVTNVAGTGGATVFISALPAMVDPISSTTCDGVSGILVSWIKTEYGSAATPYTPQSVLRQRGTYQDTTGTQPVTAVGDLVGLITDKSYGGQLGPNAFQDATVVFGGESTRVSPGVYRVYSSAGVYSSVSVGAGLTPYKTYKLKFFQDTATAGTLAVDGPAGAVTIFPSGVGERECIITMTATTTVSIKRASGVTDIQISNLQIREVPGNHATQSAVASKSSLQRVPKRLGPNLVSNGGFDNGTTGWTTLAGATLASVAGELVTTSASSAAYPGAQQVVTTTAGASYSVTAAGRRGTTASNAFVTAIAGNNLLFTTTASETKSMVVTATASSMAVAAGIFSPTGTGTAIFDNVEVREVLEWANVISFDGSNDFLTTGITTGNEGFVAAGVTFSGAVSAIETAAGSGANAPTIKGVWLARVGAVSENTLWLATGNGSTRNIAAKTDVALRNTPRVIEGGWSASTIFVGVDGAITPATPSGDLTPPASSLQIGAVTGASFFNGPMHAIAYAPTLPSAADRATIRDGIAALQGRTL